MDKAAESIGEKALPPIVPPPRPHAYITRYREEHRVLSPAVVPGPGLEFRIKNLAGQMAIVTMPSEVVGPGVLPFEIHPGETVPIRLAPGSHGAYTYSVVMRGAGGLETAHGNSDPVIIIDPPA